MAKSDMEIKIVYIMSMSMSMWDAIKLRIVSKYIPECKEFLKYIVVKKNENKTDTIKKESKGGYAI